MSDVPESDVDALIESFAASQWTELHLAIDGFELTLSNDASFGGTAGVSAPDRTAGTPASLAARQPPAAAPRDTAELDLDHAGLVAIRAPNLGHFYRAPKPGAPPFVETGSRVGEDDIVCVIEVMKLFTLLAAGVQGIVRRICVEDAAMVEFDQPLFYVEPDA